MELIFNFSMYKDKHLGQLIFEKHILDFIYKDNTLSVLVESSTSNINFSFDLLKVENRQELFNKDLILIFSKMNSIPYIKDNLPIDKIIDLFILNFELYERKLENILLYYIKIVQINDFVFMYKRKIGYISFLTLYQTSKQIKYTIDKNYSEDTFHLDIINNLNELFKDNQVLIDDIIHSVLLEIS